MSLFRFRPTALVVDCGSSKVDDLIRIVEEEGWKVTCLGLDEMMSIDVGGFDATLFEAVSKALEAGKPASELEPQLKKAEENTALMQQKAGGDTKDIIKYLMGTVGDEYGVGVEAGKITDPGEYQDAFGFSVVALKMAGRIEDPKAAVLTTELEALVALWPKGGPLADSIPTPVAKITAQTARVLKAMAALP